MWLELRQDQSGEVFEGGSRVTVNLPALLHDGVAGERRGGMKVEGVRGYES